MALQVPNRVREAWGDEVVMAFVPWLDERYITREKAVPRDEYREVLSRLDGLEKDVSLIKEELAGFRVELGQIRSESREDRGLMRAEFKDGQARLRAEFREDLGELRREMHERFDRVNQRFDEMGARFEGRFDEMNHRMLVQTRWLVGSLAILGTVISALLAIAQFTP